MRPSTLFLCILLSACSDDDRRQTSDVGPGVDAPQSDATSGQDVGVGGGLIGGPCLSDADCTEIPGLTCYQMLGGGPFPTITFPGGYCSKGCGDTMEPGGEPPPMDECGPRAGCASSTMSGGGGSSSLMICAPPCSMDSECRVDEGYRCNIVFGTFGSCGL